MHQYTLSKSLFRLITYFNGRTSFGRTFTSVGHLLTLNVQPRDEYASMHHSKAKLHLSSALKDKDDASDPDSNFDKDSLKRVTDTLTMSRDLGQRQRDVDEELKDETEKKEKEERPLPSKMGGDVNMVELIGTVVSIETLPRKNDPTRNYVKFFLRTYSPKTISPTTAEDGGEKINVPLFHRIFTFHKVQVARLAGVGPGDRLAVTGWLQYLRYEIEGSQWVDKRCIVVSQSINLMGHSGETIEQATDRGAASNWRVGPEMEEVGPGESQQD